MKRVFFTVSFIIFFSISLIIQQLYKQMETKAHVDGTLVNLMFVIFIIIVYFIFSIAIYYFGKNAQFNKKQYKIIYGSLIVSVFFLSGIIHFFIYIYSILIYNENMNSSKSQDIDRNVQDYKPKRTLNIKKINYILFGTIIILLITFIEEIFFLYLK